MKIDSLESGYSIATYDIVGSTNEEVKKLAEDGAESGTVVWSRSQTNGKGRHGNKWISPSGNLYVSILLRMESDVRIVSQVAFLSALAVRDALPLHNIYFKWPNDVLSADMRKLSGILLEGKINPKGITDWVVIGIGVNMVSHPPESEVDRPAVSLKELGYSMSVDELLQAFLDSFASWYNIWREEGFEPVRCSWLESAAFLGETVAVNIGNENVEAIFKDINEVGELVILLPDGEEVAISSGELFLGRPMDAIGN